MRVLILAFAFAAMGIGGAAIGDGHLADYGERFQAFRSEAWQRGIDVDANGFMADEFLRRTDRFAILESAIDAIAAEGWPCDSVWQIPYMRERGTALHTSVLCNRSHGGKDRYVVWRRGTETGLSPEWLARRN